MFSKVFRNPPQLWPLTSQPHNLSTYVIKVSKPSNLICIHHSAGWHKCLVGLRTKGRLHCPNVARKFTFAVRGLTPPPLIFGSYGCLETLLILVTKKGEKQNFPKHPKWPNKVDFLCEQSVSKIISSCSPLQGISSCSPLQGISSCSPVQGI